MKREEITVHTEDKKSFQKQEKEKKANGKNNPYDTWIFSQCMSQKRSKKRYSGAK